MVKMVSKLDDSNAFVAISDGKQAFIFTTGFNTWNGFL